MLIEGALRHVKFSAVLVCNLTGYVEDMGVAAAWFDVDVFFDIPLVCDFCNIYQFVMFVIFLIPISRYGLSLSWGGQPAGERDHGWGRCTDKPQICVLLVMPLSWQPRDSQIWSQSCSSRTFGYVAGKEAFFWRSHVQRWGNKAVASRSLFATSIICTFSDSNPINFIFGL